MKALICQQFGSINALRLEDIPAPALTSDQVRIAVKAASINFPDALIVQGLYQVRPTLPFSPGAELAGTITELGSDVTDWEIGDRVMACIGYGAFAEQCAVTTDALVRLPSSMAFTQGAAFVLTYGTALHALKDTAQLKAGETVLILGAAGGVGLAAIEVAKKLGARVIAAASTQEKIDLCRCVGADDVINYSKEDIKDRVKTLSNNRGVDVVCDPVGGDCSETALRCLAWRGRFLVVGFASGIIPKIPLNLTLLKERQILGVYWGDAVKRDPLNHQANMQLLTTWFEQGHIKPVVNEEIGLDQAAAAIERIANRKVKGKVVVSLQR
ncbi:NADPH:quinone oxidoreductase family protein [Paralcaligenes ureilyticus]|uniref:NADPH2:quinone reductase n=1 Tax=Paralcaligenes ureilyticus TaxID=627131 RepID=A0A4R3MA92_9BURK|nr:NADPH:quinone oxidoreductase family protein [Paralcaligenes ureilyticus]TCT09583.1 NADPH2:quinone reductase [Paralcaligenes ureilyticus]